MKKPLFSIPNLEYLSSFGVPKMKPNQTKVFHQDWINLPKGKRLLKEIHACVPSHDLSSGNSVLLHSFLSTRN